METDRTKNVVWESVKEGTRFMTTYDPNETYEDNEHNKVIGINLSYDDALVLCRETEDKNISAFMSGMPEELRSDRMDSFIESLIRNGG